MTCRSPQDLTDENSRAGSTLKEELCCEALTEVSLAIKICAEGIEALVISIHGVS